MINYLLLFGVFMLLSWPISHQLKSRIRKYSLIPLSSWVSGRDVAERMLFDNGIKDVKIISVTGELTDHYNAYSKTINLSREVYYGKHVAAGAIAAHEFRSGFKNQSASEINYGTTFLSKRDKCREK